MMRFRSLESINAQQVLTTCAASALARAARHDPRALKQLVSSAGTPVMVFGSSFTEHAIHNSWMVAGMSTGCTCGQHLLLAFA